MNKVMIYGGLGNQMFQYALNVALNQKGNKSTISLSTFFYNFHHKNGFDLNNAFKLNLPFSIKFYYFLLRFGRIFYQNNISAKILERFITQYQKKTNHIYKEKEEFIYDGNVFKQDSSLLIGTWQAEEYFKDIREAVLKEFVFNQPKDSINKKLTKEIQNCNSVSIHVRRGDYFSADWANTHAVLKDENYYINSINYLNSKIENAHYYIFSDDISWVKQNLKFKRCTFIEHNTNKYSYIDMYLMSLCRHNIIANSTFSWWGAWLNKNPNKIVVTPKQWLIDKSCEGIFPPSWIKINVQKESQFSI